MQKRIVLGFAVLLCGGMLVLQNLHGQDPETAPESCGGGTTPTCADCVCPLYCYAHHTDFCSYYAVHCPATWVSLDAGCGLMGDCNSKTNCTDVSVRTDEKKDKKDAAPSKGKQGDHHTDPALIKGGHKRKPVNPNPVPKGNREFISVVGYVVAELTTDPDAGDAGKPTVALYVMLVNPAAKGIGNQPPRLMTSGVEVESPDAVPTVKLAYSDAVLSAEGHTCMIQFGELTFRVILDPSTPIKSPAPPGAKKNEKNGGP
jgi:hypothetical protein